MKKILLLISTCILLLSFVFAVNNPHKLNNRKIEVIRGSDTINTAVMKYQATSTTASGNAASVQSLLDSVKRYPTSSYILLTKIDDETWVLETHPDFAMVTAFKPKMVMVLTGTIKIMGVKYDKERAVILQ